MGHPSSKNLNLTLFPIIPQVNFKPLCCCIFMQKIKKFPSIYFSQSSKRLIFDQLWPKTSKQSFSQKNYPSVAFILTLSPVWVPFWPKHIKIRFFPKNSSRAILKAYVKTLENVSLWQFWHLLA